MEPSALQRWLWEGMERSWQDVYDYVGTEPWVLVFNGDMVQGNYFREVDLMSQDMTDQAELAFAGLCGPARRATRRFMVRGTKVHVGTWESVLGRRLGCEPDPTTGDFCWEQLQLDINGCLTHFKHHVNTWRLPWTAGGPAARALAREQNRAAALGFPIPRMIVRSHAHEYDGYWGIGGGCVITPPCQMMGRWARGVMKDSYAIPGLVLLDYRKPRGKHRLPHWEAFLNYPDPDPVVVL